MVDVAFFGSHPLGEQCLERLHEHDETDVTVVVTYPKDEATWWDGSVHEVARDLGYPVLTIENKRDVLDYECDYLLSVYYPNILGEELLTWPEEGPLNLHQAELPRYRGSNVFSHSIMNARSDDHCKHGTTLHFMSEDVDEGDIVARKFREITEEDTARTLYDKVREASVKLFEEILPKIISGEVHNMRTPQSEFSGERYFYTKDSLGKYIPKERLCDPDQRQAVYDKIRALDFPPFKPAYTTVAGEEIHLTKSSYTDYPNLTD
jgi:methionyl-tRNA formyltransferase